MKWIVAQIGAREHYAVGRALHKTNSLKCLITDFWLAPHKKVLRSILGQRFMGRWHADLSSAEVYSRNSVSLIQELNLRTLKRNKWDQILQRNENFGRNACKVLAKISRSNGRGKQEITIFAYSYAALEIFQMAKAFGWRTVLGQIDPGPIEEKIVADEKAMYPQIVSSWKPAPTRYWNRWKSEVNLSEIIIANSNWSLECLTQAGVPPSKIRMIPLAYESEDVATRSQTRHFREGSRRPLKMLFLGQVGLRKGALRLLEAMELLRDEPVELMLVGPSEFSMENWKHLAKVNWLDSVPRNEVTRFYQDSDIFILPTLSDGYAITQLEAISNGLPIIVSKNCGEVVKHRINGWLLDDLKPQTIANAIKSIIDKNCDFTVDKMEGLSLRALGEILSSI